MLKIAIVGNIASGKSVVEKFIQEKGFAVYDTDKIAHKILESNNEIVKLFNTNNRKEISKIVFSNKEKLKELELIIHPLVKIEIEKIFKQDLKIVFISVPQLFEAGFESMFDKILFITSDVNIRKERLMKRNNLTEIEALLRIQAQIKDEEKISKSDYVIENNSDLTSLKQNVEKFLDQYTKWKN